MIGNLISKYLLYEIKVKEAVQVVLIILLIFCFTQYKDVGYIFN